MSKLDEQDSLDSKEALEIANAWESYMNSWRAEKQLSELFETLKREHSNALSAGQFLAVHNSIYKFIHEVERFGSEGDGFLEPAEFLTKQLLETGNPYAASAINTLTFSLMFSLDNYSRAEFWLTKAVQLEAGDESENALNNLAITFLMQGMEEKALALFLRSWGLGSANLRSSNLQPEAMFHLAHLLGSCSTSAFTRKILFDVTQAPDTDYATRAQSCLWGQCSSSYKPSLNSVRNAVGTKELLNCEPKDYVSNLYPRLSEHVALLEGHGPLEAVDLDIENFESAKFTLEHVLAHGSATAPLIEFSQVHAIGNLEIHKLAMSIVLYRETSASFSTLGCTLLAEWSRGNLPNSVAIAQILLAQENFSPVKQPLLNYAAQESLLSGMRTNSEDVASARSSIYWERSYNKAVAGFPMLSIMQTQAEEGDLQKLASGLSEYCRSDYASRYKDTTSVIPLLANELLTFLMADGDAYLNFDSSKAFISVANTLGIGESDDDYLLLLAGAKQFIDRRLSLILGVSRDHEYGYLTADDIYFLATSVFAFSSSDLRALVKKCAAVKSWNLVSKSIFPLIDKIAILAWSRGAVIDWSDENLKSLVGLIETVGNSESLADIMLMWENTSLRPILEGIESPMAQVVRRTGLMALKTEALEALDTKSLLALCRIRSMPAKFYEFAMAKVPIEGVATLATNPDAFEIVQQHLVEQLPQDAELAFVAANSFVQDQSPDWPRSLPRILASMLNPRGLALLASDQRLQDIDLQLIAAKADKKIATLIKDHPNASDETKALAQLVA